jgi:hypothetical protein
MAATNTLRHSASVIPAKLRKKLSVSVDRSLGRSSFGYL